mmetsp:Transcript_96566/g.171687  ORF Transcript_96566/g.171687 Transcript_96566/m.171687 type:complete len:355 (+) Transcript_96566:97-1161(+)
MSHGLTTTPLQQGSKSEGTSTEYAVGTLVYCCIQCCDTAQMIESVVVEPGMWQTVIACPSGDWLRHVGTHFVSECEDGGASCEVVFLSVDPTSLVATPLPGSHRFSSIPLTENLLELFSESELDSVHMPTRKAGDVRSQDKYFEVRIGREHSLFHCNSVLVLPNFLTKAECHVLMDAADQASSSSVTREGCEAKRMRSSYTSSGQGLSRLPLCNLNSEAQLLSTSLLCDKLLTFFEQHLPDLARQLFGQAEGLAKMKFAFPWAEPAVNRYTQGGDFGPHTDLQAVTINVVLSDPGAFTGGGTVFWPQGSLDELTLLRPQQGTAVLFHGQLKHAGREVTSGVRHLYVASFSLSSE